MLNSKVFGDDFFFKWVQCEKQKLMGNQIWGIVPTWIKHIGCAQMGRSVHYAIKCLQWFQLGVTSVSDTKNSTVDNHLTTQSLAVIIEYEPSLWVFTCLFWT